MVRTLFVHSVFMKLPAFHTAHEFFFLFRRIAGLDNLLQGFVKSPVIQAAVLQVGEGFFFEIPKAYRYGPGYGHFYIIPFVVYFIKNGKNFFQIFLLYKVSQDHNNGKTDIVFPAALQIRLQKLPDISGFRLWKFHGNTDAVTQRPVADFGDDPL